MKNKINIILLLFASVIFSSCEIIGGIFKAGVWTGIFIVIAIIVLIIFIIARSGKNN